MKASGAQIARILTLTTNPAIDISTSIDSVTSERKLRCNRPSYHPGGGGLNVSRAIYQLGGESTALYISGGETGDLLQQLLKDTKFDSIPVKAADRTRENFAVIENSSGEIYRFVMPGPQIEEDEWQNCLKKLESLDEPPDYAVLSGSLSPGIPDDFYARAANALGEKTKIVVDTSGEPLRRSVEAKVYLLKPNLRELRQLTGQDLAEEEEQEEAVRELIGQKKAEVVVLSLGAAGALLATRDTMKRIQAPTVPIKSKVGAGDSTVAGIVLALARGLSTEDAAIYGVAAGAAAVMTPGTELCHRDDTERLFERTREKNA